MNLQRLVLSVAVTVSCFTTPAVAGPRYVEDFSRPADAWRFGNAVLSGGSDGLSLDAWQPEATLVGTTVHPENLRTFTLKLRWSFGKTSQPVLLVGWGKPFEWSRFEECPCHLFVGRDGRVTVKAGAQTIGAAQLAAPESGAYTLVLAQETNRVVLHGDRGETAFPLPAGHDARPGYFTLRVQGLAAGPGEEPLKVQRIEIEHSGQKTSLTREQRNREIQAWAKTRFVANRPVLEQFKARLLEEAQAGRWGYKTSLTVRPGLVKAGEKVELLFHAAGAIPEPWDARVEPDFLRTVPVKAERLVSDWQPDGHGGHTTRITLSPSVPGNWRVVWRAGQEELSRTFAVVDRGYAVCRFLVTTHPGMWKPGHAPEAYHVIHEHGLAADFWDGAEWVSPFSRTPESLLNHFRVFAQFRHRWGDRVFPLCNANWMIPGCPDTNLWRLDGDLQREGLTQIMELWEALGLGRMEVLGSYTFGHATPAVAKGLGIKMLDSLVQWQNWRDGGDDNAWLINQWGAPTVPYYVGDDDYRKVAPGKSIVAFTQATTSSVRIYYINTLEGQPQLSFLRRRSQEMGETANIDRFQTAVDLWLAEAPHQAEPLFLSVGLENFVDLPDWNEANKLGVKHLLDRARHKNLVFTSSADIADYFHRHYERQPENWFYWPDIYAGLQAAYKPRRVPDRIELSNAESHTVHEDGSALPRFFWDYTRPWSEPIWLDQAEIRQKHGLVTPEALTAENCVPRMVNLEGVKADVKIERQTTGAALRVTIDISRPLKMLPVAAWKVPLDSEAQSVPGGSEDTRFVRVVDGSTGNLHGILVCHDLPQGQSVRIVQLRGKPREPLEPGVRIGPHVAGRQFLREGTPHVYLWLADEKSPTGVLTIRVPPGRKAALHGNDGRTVETTGGVLTTTLDRAWQHESPLVIGLTADDLQASSAFEPASRKEPQRQ